MPASAVIPVLGYPDVRDAVAWLTAAFGCAERLRIGEHRAQLTLGEGDVVVAQGAGGAAVLVRVPDADAHHRRAAAAGARIMAAPTDHPFGERQYTAEDPGGNRWTFSQTIADVAPRVWGGTIVE